MQYTLKELRARNDWTQQDVAKKLGISTQTYNAWENDFGKVKVRAASNLTKLYGVTLDQIKFN